MATRFIARIPNTDNSPTEINIPAPTGRIRLGRSWTRISEQNKVFLEKKYADRIATGELLIEEEDVTN